MEFKPRFDEMYWCVGYWGEDEIYCEWRIWTDSALDFAFLKVGNCFKTFAEAEENKVKVYESLTGKGWENAD